MGTCWYCHWGWAKPVAEIYQEALRRLGGNESPLLYGPSHIVWEDENFEGAEWCLDHFEENVGDYSTNEFAIVRWSLNELIKLPVDVRCPEPEDYEGEDVESYPPLVDVVKIRS